MTGMVPEAEKGAIRRGIAAKRLAGLAVAILLVGCQAAPSLVKPRLEDDGQVFLYLQPLQGESARLAFRLDRITAVREDGGAVPIQIHAGEIGGKEPQGDRLLASGVLPPGRYAGLGFHAKSATLQGEDGIAALSIPDEDSVSPVPFAIAKRKAQVVSLKFRYQESLQGGVRFAPSFSAEIPGKIASGLIGLITSRGGNTVTVFDKMAGKVAGVIPTGAAPVGMILNPVLNRAYVAVSGDDTVEAIDLQGGDVILRGQLSVGDRPEEILLTPDRKYLLTANSGSDTVSVIDTTTLIEGRRVRVGSGPQSLLLDRAGRRVYVFNTLSDTISVLDLGTFAVTATIISDSGPVRGDFNRAGNRLYVLYRNSPYLGVFDPATRSVFRRVYVGSGATALKVDRQTDRIYLARRGAGEIAIYDPSSLLPVASIRTGQDASYLAIDGETNNLLAVLPEVNEARVIQLVGNRTVSRVEVGDTPAWVSLMGER